MGRAVGSWPRRVLLLPPRPGRAARSSWAVGARAEVLEVDTYGGQNGSMLTGVDVASSQPALAYLVGPLCVMDRGSLTVALSTPWRGIVLTCPYSDASSW